MSPKKLELDLGALSVETFATGDARDGSGTVEGAAAGPCTCAASCPCPTSLYRCGELRETLYSCNFTFEEPSCYAIPQTEFNTCRDCV